jgi:hypothetical protein
MEAGFEQEDEKEEEEYQHDGDHDDHPDGDMQNNEDPRKYVEATPDPIPRVAGPSGIRSSSYAASNTSVSNLTSSFGIQDPWGVTPDVATSVGSSRSFSVHDGEASESRKFDILYIPDPSRAMMKKDAVLNLGWTTRDITPAHYESIKHLTELVYKIGSTKDRVDVLITEWVSIFPVSGHLRIDANHSYGYFSRWTSLSTARHSTFSS